MLVTITGDAIFHGQKITRDEFFAKLESFGHKTQNHFSTKLDLVIEGFDPRPRLTGKAKKAIKYGVPVVTMREFVKNYI